MTDASFMSHTFAASPNNVANVGGSVVHKRTTSKNLKERRNIQLRIQKQKTGIERKTLSVSPYNKTPVIKTRLLNNPGRDTIKNMKAG